MMGEGVEDDQVRGWSLMGEGWSMMCEGVENDG